ncbi:MAG: PilZ domain-containing protein, partial [Planctomycetota bacterium]|jgi:c-di-GMP-binding flagellar brake protein YcgR
MPVEKREFPRVVSVNLVSCKDVKDPEGTESMGRTRNLSLGGMLLEVHNYYPLSSVIELQIALGEKIIRPLGRVVRLQELESNMVEMGIRFTEVSEQDRTALQEHIGNL